MSGQAESEVKRSSFQDAARMLDAMVGILGKTALTAYLAMMAVRLVELHRVLKPTGSLYLHCDPTASHCRKILLDAVFGAVNFRNEIVWQRSQPKGHAFTRFATSHDIIFSYAKSIGVSKWHPIYAAYDKATVERQYAQIDETGRRYQLTSLLNPNMERPNPRAPLKIALSFMLRYRETMIVAPFEDTSPSRRSLSRPVAASKVANVPIVGNQRAVAAHPFDPEIPGGPGAPVYRVDVRRLPPVRP